MLPAVRGILPRASRGVFRTKVVGEPGGSAPEEPSGKIPNGASNMLALPQARRCSFLIRAITISGCAVLVSSACAQTDSQYAKANEDYAQGKFKEAIGGYEALVQSRQWSANLFYDLGNAYFRTQDFGRAILNYERALALDQRHPESGANLRVARDEARALEMQPDWIERHLELVSVTRYGIVAAIAFWIGAFCLVIIWRARPRPAKATALAILSFAICAGAALAIHQIERAQEGAAIVTGNDVQARLATADNANSVLALPPGSEIKILSTRGDWIYAALPNSLRGWIPAKDAELVRL
jgi:tetratricopeptide (TPR) repeat protein